MSAVVQTRFYAQYADGREERVTVTVLADEVLDDAVQRTRLELGAVAIVLKPEQQEAQVPAV